MTTLILHLGAHKTGTSLLQKFLRDKSELCAANGIVGFSRSDGDRYIGWAKKNDFLKQRDTLLDRLSKVQSNSVDFYILSHENTLGKPFIEGEEELYPQAASKLNNLKKYLPEMDVEVIYYIRSQAAFMESYYLQTIHQGSFQHFENFLKNVKFEHMSWRPALKAIQKSFAGSPVSIKSFEKEIGNGQEAFLKNFFFCFMGDGVDNFDSWKYNPVRNPSIGDRGLELSLIINQYLEGRDEKRLFRKFFQSNFSNRDYPRPQLLNKSQKKYISDLYDEENKALVKTT